MKRKLFIFFIPFLILTGRIALGYNLPLPENTIKQDEQKVEINGVSYNLEIYQSQLSFEEITSFFKEKLASEGFILINENKAINTLLFAHLQLKENLSIQRNDNQGGLTYFTVCSWKGDLFKQATPSTLNRDLRGSDLAGIPRYPGSIRISNINSGQMKSAAYKTLQKKEDIVSFYESQMPSYGWKKFPRALSIKQKAIESMGKGIEQDTELLIFEKNNFVCSIVVGPETKCSKDVCSREDNSENNIISIVIVSKAAD